MVLPALSQVAIMLRWKHQNKEIRLYSLMTCHTEGSESATSSGSSSVLARHLLEFRFQCNGGALG